MGTFFYFFFKIQVIFVQVLLNSFIINLFMISVILCYLNVYMGGKNIKLICITLLYLMPGGFVLSWGLIGSIFSRNLSTLGNGLLFGGALLALSIYSLKVWRQGKSSVPFVLGQAGKLLNSGLLNNCL